jgi:drug/metabolite transporter (DMT)-like permease
MQALEKPDTSNRSRGDVKLMGSAPEAEVSGGGFECSQRIERWQKISHRWSISGQLEIDFLRSPQRFLRCATLQHLSRFVRLQARVRVPCVHAERPTGEAMFVIRREQVDRILVSFVLIVMPLLLVSNFIIGRAAVAAVAPWTLAFLRWFIAAIIVAPFAVGPVRRHLSGILRAWKLLIVLGFLGMWICGGIVYLSLHETTATTATLIFMTSPILVVLIESLFNPERPSFTRIAGLLCGMAGVAIMILGRNPGSISVSNFHLGDVGIVASSLAWALYSLLLRLQTLKTLPTVAVVWAVMIAGTLTLLPFMVWESISSGFPLSGAAWMSIAGAAIVPTALAFFAYQYAVVTVGPATTSVFLYLMPCYGAVLAIVFLDEAIHLYQGIAAILVGLGIFFAVYGRQFFGLVQHRPLQR